MTNRTCIITQNAIQYLLLLIFAVGMIGAVGWFFWPLVVPFFGR